MSLDPNAAHEESASDCGQTNKYKRFIIIHITKTQRFDHRFIVRQILSTPLFWATVGSETKVWFKIYGRIKKS